MQNRALIALLKTQWHADNLNHMQLSVMLVMMLMLMCMARFLALCAKLIKGCTLVQKEVVEFTSMSQEWWEKRPLTPEWFSYSFALSKRDKVIQKETDGLMKYIHRWPLCSKRHNKKFEWKRWMKTEWERIAAAFFKLHSSVFFSSISERVRTLYDEELLKNEQ